MPMKNRILSVVLAISMIAVVFSAIPTRAETNDTGVVVATDVSNNPKSVFIQGELIYFDVKTVHLGNVSSQVATVYISGTGVSRTVTTNATTGWYNSSSATPRTWLATGGLGIGGDVQAYDVIADVGGTEISRYPIIIKRAGLTLDPPTMNYWPGLVVQWKLVTSHMTESLYVQILNDTGVTVSNTSVLASIGYVAGSFTVGDWKDGLYDMNVRYASNHSSLPYTATFFVAKYDFSVILERTWYLPGETALIDYQVTDRGSAGVATGVTINFWAQWWVHEGNKTVRKWTNSTLSPSETLQQFPIPANIALNHTPAVQIDYWANATNRSIHQSVDLRVDVISETITLNSGAFNPGDTVVVTVHSYVAGIPPVELPDANVSISVTRNGTEVIDAYGTSSLVTDAVGTASHVFVLDNSSQRGTYVVKAIVSKLGFTTSREAQFTVSFSGGLVALFDKAYYYGGERATVHFEAMWNKATIPTAVVGYTFLLNSKILTMGNTTGSSVAVDIPQDFSGIVVVNAKMVYLGYQLFGADAATVYLAQMNLQATKTDYRAGDSMTFSWTIVTGITSGSLSWEIIDSHGVRVADGAPAFAKTGFFKYRVPSEDPANAYQATLRMISSSGAYAFASDMVTLVSALELKVWVEKSPYADGMFAPGQSLSIKYSITTPTIDETGRPAYRLHVAVDNDPIELDVLTSKASGEITYKVPKTASVGQLNVDVTLYDAAVGTNLGTSSTAFVVNNRESAWDRSLGGISIIDLVLLILLVVVILVLIVMPIMKSRMGKPKAPEVAPPAPPMEPGKMPPSP